MNGKIYVQNIYDSETIKPNYPVLCLIFWEEIVAIKEQKVTILPLGMRKFLPYKEQKVTM